MRNAFMKSNSLYAGFWKVPASVEKMNHRAKRFQITTKSSQEGRRCSEDENHKQ